MQEIISTNNTKVKYIAQLQKKSALRQQLQEFVIEGLRELEAALKNRFVIKTIYFYPDLVEEQILYKWKEIYKSDFEMVKISKNVFKKLSYRNSTEGIIAVGKMKSHHIKDIKLSKNPLLLVAESIEKPGNMGAMLRSLDGAGVDAFVLVNSKVDMYNPNVIRSSLGMVFSKQIAVANMAEMAIFLKENSIKLFGATLQNANVYHLEDFTKPSAIAVGAEDKGLSENFRKLMQQAVYIPMLGQADSLNVSVSAAVLLYEALRQRNLSN